MKIKVIASGSSGNAYVVDDGKTAILIECGVEFKTIQRAFNFEVNKKIAACFITHEHKDHCRCARQLLKNGIECYASRGTWKAMGLTSDSPLSFYMVSMKPFNSEGYKRYDGKIDYNEQKVGTLTIMAFPVEHDAEEPFGFLIDSEETGDRLLYFTDTKFLRYRFPQVSIIMAECNYDNDVLVESVERGNTPLSLVRRVTDSHMSLDTLCDMLITTDKTSLKEVHLIHLSSARSAEEKMKKRVQEITGVPVYIH